jgi:hypothetical protein
MPTASTFETALPEIIPNKAEPTTAILEAAHGRHGNVGEEIGAAGARQDLAEDRERNHDQHRDLEDRADDAVDVEPDIDDEPFRGHVAGLEVAGQIRADVDVDRHRQDDADEAPAGNPAAPFKYQNGEDRAADDAFARQQRDLIGQRLVAHRDVAAEQERDGGGAPVDRARRPGPIADDRPHQRQAQAADGPRRNFIRRDVSEHDIDGEEDRRHRAAPVDRGGLARPAGDEGEREREAETDREQLLGIERDVEAASGNVEYPEHDDGDQQRLQDIGAQHRRLRRGGGELRRVGDDAFFGRGAVNGTLLAHKMSLATRLCSWKYFTAPG